MTLKQLLKLDRSHKKGVLDLSNRSLMRQVAAAAFVAAVLAMSGLARAGEDANDTKLRATGGCTFNSKLSLTVYVVRKAGGMPEVIGRTPSAKPIVIPRCVSWVVLPAAPLDMRALAKEIASKGLAGLRLPWRAVDADLAHLKGLTGLRGLDLRGTKITDGGLAHLKGLAGLRVLDLRRTKITNAGAASLEKALPELVIMK